MAWAKAVVLSHGSGIETTYGHMAQLDPAMKVGAKVTIGQRLGMEGSTGNSTGNHLHFAVTTNRTPIDPVPFMNARGAPLNGKAVAPSSVPPPEAGLSRAGKTDPVEEGGVGFSLPAPGGQRQDSLHNPPLPIPGHVKALYEAAADRFKIPWTVLAGIGMAETGHGRNNHASSSGAQGLMQSMPATFATLGIDGDGDGRADISNDADSVFSAANYLVKSGVTKGTAGVRRALLAYNHVNWYVDDVLYYAQQYGGWTVLGDPTDCGPGTGNGNPNLPPLADERLTAVLKWATSHVGDGYVLGARGPLDRQRPT